VNLEVRIPNELRVYLSDLRILRELVNCAWVCLCAPGVFVGVTDKGLAGSGVRKSGKQGTYKEVFLDRGRKSAVMAGLVGLYKIEHD
jgi:hypothetical protein